MYTKQDMRNLYRRITKKLKGRKRPVLGEVSQEKTSWRKDIFPFKEINMILDND